MNYHNKKFKAVVNSKEGEITPDTIFHYNQEGNILTATYYGEKIVKGHLLGLVDQHGVINMKYHQVNTKGELQSGVCVSKPRITSEGKIRLEEQWQWTSGTMAKGSSVLEEI